MAGILKRIRRIVTGNDERGRSRVVWDGPAPEAPRDGHERPWQPDRGHTNLWVWNQSPAPLFGDRDDGNLPYVFPGPPKGGHFRVVQWPGRPADYDPANDPHRVPVHEPKKQAGSSRWDRGGGSDYTSGIHKSETVDYGILLEGEIVLVLDDCELSMRPGDVVVDVGAWHQWSHPAGGGLMAFDMIAAHFTDGPAGLAQGHDTVMRPDSSQKLPEGVKPTRRIVTIDRQAGRGSLVSDAPSPDVRIDPARPGFAAARMWVTDSTPAKIVFETLHLPHTIEPPPLGSVLRVVTFPPDESWKGKVGAVDVQAFFRAMGSPAASTYSPQAPHPYMQKTRTLDFCIVLEGEIVLVLDTQEVPLSKGEIVVQRGTNHAWSNRSNNAAVLAIASHDAVYSA